MPRNAEYSTLSLVMDDSDLCADVVRIHVGTPSNKVTFRVDMRLLVDGSPYFRQLITSKSRGNKSHMFEFAIPHMRSEVFEAILR
jgi:hypothetical protein